MADEVEVNDKPKADLGPAAPVAPVPPVKAAPKQAVPSLPLPKGVTLK